MLAKKKHASHTHDKANISSDDVDELWFYCNDCLASVTQDRKRDVFEVEHVMHGLLICVQGLTRKVRSSYVIGASSLL